MAKREKKSGKKRAERKPGAMRAGVKRLNRLIGQAEGIRSMVWQGRPVEEILHQCKAAHAALRGLEIKLLESHLEKAADHLIKADGRKERQATLKRLVELYNPVR